MLLEKAATCSGRMGGSFFFYIMISMSLFLALCARSPRLQLLEEVVALVIYEDECREVLCGNLPDCLHTKLWVLYALNALDRTLFFVK